MKTFIFTQKNSSATIVLSAENFEEALKELEDHTEDTYGWRVEDEEGEDEDY